MEQKGEFIFVHVLLSLRFACGMDCIFFNAFTGGHVHSNVKQNSQIDNAIILAVEQLFTSTAEKTRPLFETH